MDIVTIDLETYYDREYSLSKMTTEAYVRDPRFEVVGVAIKVNGFPTDWYSGSDPGKFLRQLNYRDKAILCHNTAFDGAILSWHYGIRPKLWLDTLSMARPLHGSTIGVSLKALATHYGLGEKGDEVLRTLGMRRADFTPDAMARYAEYCVKDVDLTYALFRKLAKGFPSQEIHLIDTILRMYTEPSLVLDTDLLNKHLDEVVTRKQALLDSFGQAGDDDTKSLLMSNEKFAAYLRDCGVTPPTKISKTTGKPTYAFSKTDNVFTSMVEHPDERVSTAVAARLGVKSTIEESRTRSLLSVASRGPLPIMLNYYGAHTGRLSGGDKMNLQNLPRGGALRRSLCAPDGKLLVACDSSQIEARVVAWLAGQSDLLEAFAQGRDVYSEFASAVYQRKVSKSDKLERFVGKTCILGLGYGMGAAKFRDTLALGMGGIKVEIEEVEALRIVKLYREKNSRIAMLWTRCSSALNSIAGGMEFDIAPKVLASLVTTKEGIRLPNNLAIRYPALQETDQNGYVYASDQRQFREALRARVVGEPVEADKMTRIYGGKVVENIVQAVARIVVTDQLVEISKRYKVVLQVHDEVVIVCDEDEAEEAKAFVMGVMSTPPEWAKGLPVACEADVGKTYGDAK
jgi:DNA polymerase I-like protein with 3'-5' exonuclease and polymerase domains